MATKSREVIWGGRIMGAKMRAEAARKAAKEAALKLPDGLPEAVQLNRSGVSGLSKPAQGGVTTIGTFN